MMTRQEFINSLRRRLSGLPKEEVEGRLEFYSEMISDRIDEGISEEKAVRDIGSIDDVAEQILAEIPLRKIVKENIKNKPRLNGRELTLLIIGFPIWLPLLISAFAVAISLFASLFAVVISLWAADLALFVSPLVGILGFILYAVSGNFAFGLALLGMGIVAASLAIFFFFACKRASKFSVWLTKKCILFIKRCFIKRGV